MNFARDVVDAAQPSGSALVELDRNGGRRVWSFGEVADQAARLAGTLETSGVRRGDVVMTLIGNRPEWVLAMVACFRIGAVVLPCTEQLRAKDLALRLREVNPVVVLADERNRTELEAAIAEYERTPHVLLLPDATLFAGPAAQAVELAPSDPCLITFTSGTSGAPRAALHAHRYLFGQRLQAEHWLGAQPRDLVWCTASSGWSKSARNAFIAPWLRGAAGLLHDARFDPDERLAIIEQESVRVLCMAPTEYRVIANRASLHRLPSIRQLVAAGEALAPDVVGAWQVATGVSIRDGYGQTETGQITGNRVGEKPRSGSMGRPLPGVVVDVVDGELVVEPATVPTFFLGYIGDKALGRAERWSTGDRVRRDADGYLYFEGRRDDVIISAGYRIGPFEVESALSTHPAVADVAVVAAPDPERGSVVRAVVVLRDGGAGGEALVRELQDHVKSLTAPYKYPRVVEFVPQLPKTASGKIKRAELRAAPSR